METRNTQEASCAGREATLHGPGQPMTRQETIDLAFALHVLDVRWEREGTSAPMAYMNARQHARVLVAQLGGNVALFDQAVEYGIVGADDYWD